MGRLDTRIRGDGWSLTSGQRGSSVANTPHGAAPSALGYQHQTWWALLELLRMGAHRPDATITLELHDDVAWEQNGTPTELLQLKHHQNQQRQLTDASPDLWSTLKVWMDTARPADPTGPTLMLVTTQTASESSAVAALRAHPRNEQFALDGLEAVAVDATSGATGQARRQFLELGSIDRRAFVSRIRLVDGSCRIEEVADGVRRALWWALPNGHEDQFLAMVWRWWDEQALALLRGQQAGVGVEYAKAAIARIRDQFTQGDLPTCIELADVDRAAVTADHEGALFVRQMQWVAYPQRSLESAIVDFYRANTQTINWLDVGHIGQEDLRRLHAEIIDEWGRAFDMMEMELAPDAEEVLKQKEGRRLLHALTQNPAATIRPRYTDAYFTRGQRHILADHGQIGWHVDYAQLIADPRTDQP